VAVACVSLQQDVEEVANSMSDSIILLNEKAKGRFAVRVSIIWGCFESYESGRVRSFELCFFFFLAFFSNGLTENKSD
jgi:hypothetical protein